MQFPPIAVVGRGCVLPGAPTPAALWELVVSGRCALTRVPQGRWRVPADRIVPGHAPHDVAGYVTGFDEVFDSDGCDEPVPADTAARWTLHAARRALAEAGPRAPERARSGLVLGWLALPDEALTRDVEEAWQSGIRLDARARRRHVSPADRCARALGFGGGALALDAACASSLYALKLACDRLHDGSADLMVAGGVSAADPLLIQTGFTALSALSRSGRSRPLHRDADGLVPAEGAALVAVMRLEDAVARGVPVLGVIRGIGLSNDGRGEGLLVPAEAGQLRAMRSAYTAAGLGPETVTLLECHAAGTVRGDATEVRSSAEVFAGARDLVVGAVKENVGHTMTAAGAVGLLKVLSAIEHGIRPLVHEATDHPLRALRGTVLRLPRENEAWDGPRRAAVSAFGFGGNNAHVVLDAPDLVSDSGTRARRRSATPPQIAVVGVGVRTAHIKGTPEFLDALFAGTQVTGTCDSIDVRLDGLRFPPADLRAALARQVLVFEAAREAADGHSLPTDRSQVLIATECDPETVRHTARLRESGDPVYGHADAQHGPGLESAQVVGFLANMTANRISSQLGLAGASYAVGSGPGTDVVALAARAITTGAADAVVVGAVDVACPSVGDEPGDAAAVLVLKRLDHARRDGEPILGILDPAGPAVAASAEALLTVVSELLARYHRASPRPSATAEPRLAAAVHALAYDAAADASADTADRPGTPGTPDTAVGWTAQPPPRWHVFSGADRAEVLAALDKGIESRGGPARLVVVAAEGEFEQRAQQARRWLLGRTPKPRATAYRERPLSGRIAFVYPGGAAAYPDMGAQLALAFPRLVAGLVERCPALAEVASWVYDGRQRPGDTISCVWGAALLAHLHTEISRGMLGVEPDAALGYSSGESTALTALGAWPDLQGLVRDLRSSPLFTRELAGSYDAVGRAWARTGVAGRSWRTYLVTVPADHARAALADESGVYLMADNSPQCCTLGGEPKACERVLAKLGADRAIALDYDLAVHAPVVDEVREQWRRLHLRPTREVPGITFYGCARAEPYALDAVAAADANTAQALGTVDFRGTVERAWADGVRIFIEHGPSGGCTDWIAQTLGEQEHLAVALDGPGVTDLDKLAYAVAELIAAGVGVDDARLTQHLAAAGGQGSKTSGRRLSIPAHPPQPATVPLAPTPAANLIPAPTSALVRAISTHHELVGARHLDFVRLLQERHADFLIQRQRIHQALVSVAASLPSPPSAVLFDRADLEFLAVGPVSVLFGAAFTELDGFPRHTRMPGPPMLLADRVLSIDAAPATLGTGSIRTETDVRADSWYLDPAGRMPAGLMVEAGQADLLLISWLGADLVTRGERVYRLLGCEITFHGSPPHPGETLAFDIAVDGHAEHGGTRLFFFHYDCRVNGAARLTVRNGQAGFFTDAELAGARGVLWERPQLVTGAVWSFGRDLVRAFAEGRLADCFGPGFEAVGAHVRTPRPAVSAARLLFDEVGAFDPASGYVRATLPIRPDGWFFEGHFAADPCMPGTLMLEGCFQLMAFHLTAAALTVTRDGWRFEPVPERTCRISCRAQVTPRSKVLSYELFITGFEDGPNPLLVADVLCSVDGVDAFLAEGLALRLVPDWPLDRWRWLGGLDGHVESRPVARLGTSSTPLGLESLLACAWGRPSEMMGEVLAPMDDGRRLARLPGPPYHFISRISELDERRVVAEYDIPADAWFWDGERGERGERTVLPLCVLLEAALQPCGWLALYTGGIPQAGTELLFRNLDGHGTLAAVPRGTRMLRIEVRLTDISRAGDVILDAFEVHVWADDRSVGELRSGFGFFPPGSFADRSGLDGPPWSGDARDDGDGNCSVPPSPGETVPGLAVTSAGGSIPTLALLDRVTGFWPQDRRIRAEKDIAPDDWYFRAHFFQDPVQPGSLGLEAMLELLRCHLVADASASPGAEFEPWLDRQPLEWRYRGQVVPTDRVTAIDLQVVDSGRDYAVAEAWLSVDGRPIYHVTGLCLRIIEVCDEEVLDPAVETWITDHRPTWTEPALPMMSVVDRLAAAAGRRPVPGLRDVRLDGWIVLGGPVRLRGRAEGSRVELEVDGAAAASASVAAQHSMATPPSLEPLVDPRPADPPYARGGVFHGPAFRYLTRLELGTNGARGVLDAAHGSVPRGRLHQGLLDATLHVIPHDELWRWSDRIRPGNVGYPYRLPWIDFFAELPDSGTVTVEARFAGFEDDVEILPAFELRVYRDERLLVAYRLVEILVPLGPLARLDARERMVFLRDRAYVPGAGLATFEGEATRLRARDLEALEWFPGTVAALYGLPPGADRLAEVAVRDHVAHRARVHPGTVAPSPDFASATILGRPGERYDVVLERAGDTVTVRDPG